MEADIVCVGFGPATGGFLTTLSRALTDAEGKTLLESRVQPGLPLQVLCYERADDISFGVSGVVSKARAIRSSFPNTDLSEIPMAFPVKHEKVFYLLDPTGASHRSKSLRGLDRLTKIFKKILPYRDFAVELPYIPPFLSKENGFLFSVGQLNQWAGSQLMASGLVQIWPGMPVREPLLESDKVVGVRMVDQGTDKSGAPAANFMPGMDLRAALTVVGDGPVGAVGQKLNEHFGMPAGHHQRDWAIGMKMVVELPENCTLEPGTVFHTFGYPEPEIFGFLYVYPNRMASLGIFVPSWFDSPVRTGYRYLQHWMMHPCLWKHLDGGTLRSWGAKSLQESGKRGEPFLVGDGFARIGEGSGSTNVLTGSGVDEAWATGTQLAEAVIELCRSGRPFTKENLENTYVKKRRQSWVEKEARVAEKARDGFQKGFIRGLMGMALAGMSGGILSIPGKSRRPHDRIPTLEEYYKGILPPQEVERIRQMCKASGTSLHNTLMDRCGWPKIAYDGKLLVSHQDALILGGKVQAPGGFADHVRFKDPEICRQCGAKVCIEGCSGQAITPGEEGVPQFDREKCVFCGACLWNCSKPGRDDPEHGNIAFTAGAGGLHSTIN
jgi:electron-transferring-flavoprotein dehydrogenase